MVVVKRDGQRVEFDMERIKNAILKAAKACDREISDVRLSGICGSIKGKLEYQEQTGKLNEISVEAIQDIVESELMSFDDLTEIAKAYILYRNQRTQIREVNSNLMKTLHGIFSVSREDNDLKRENANINTDAPMGVMLKVGSETSKEYALKYVMRPEHMQAHVDGDIHVHDLDFYLTTDTCVQIPLAKLLARGFTTGHGYLRPPKNINSASALTCIAIQSSQNDMHGGQAVPCFDYDLAPYVALTFVTDIATVAEDYLTVKQDEEDADVLSCVVNFEKLFKKGKETLKAKADNYYDIHGTIMDKDSADFMIDLISDAYLVERRIAKRIYNRAYERTQGRTYQAMEALVHNLNTMNSRAGSQVPFSSINMGTCVTEEGREVIRNLLLAMEAGLGHHETSFFPVVIFRMKSGVNFNKSDKNYDLFKLAIRVSAKRLFPCFSNVDAPFNAQYYKEGRPETEIAYMGCVDGTQLVTYRVGATSYINSIATLYERYVQDIKDSVSKGIPMSNWSIYDSCKGNWVGLNDVICNNPEVSAKIGWRELLLSNGQVIKATADHPFVVKRDNLTEYVRVSDLHIGDKILVADMADSFAQLVEKNKLSEDIGYTLGVLVAKGSRKDDGSFEVKSSDGVKVDTQRIDSVLKIKYISKTHICITAEAMAAFEQTLGIASESFIAVDGGYNMNKVPSVVYEAPKKTRLAFIAGFCDIMGVKVKADEHGKIYATVRSWNKGTLFNSLQMLFRSVDSVMWYDSAKVEAGAKMIINCCFAYTKELGAVLKPTNKETGVEYVTDAYMPVTVPETLDVISVKVLASNVECSYDVTTETGTFDVTGLRSHNCRTRVIGNVYDPTREITVGRGNLSFTSINLPRLGILAEHNIAKFYELLDEKLVLVKDQLLDRFKIQSSKHVYNYPMLMGQGEWIDSDKLSQNDCVGEILKHGSLSIGFIGLAECLTALIGKHHGESEEAQKLGLEIVKHMRDYLDKVSEEMKLNFGLLATPKICGHLCRNV